MTFPMVILLFSGKRKSGKDYICGKLQSILGNEKSTIIRISEPLKGIYAKYHNLDLKELLSDGPYKEIYRSEMIKWSEEERNKNLGIFCKAACDSAPITQIWIVSDIRRKTDIEWFKNTYGDLVKTIKITANIQIREKRGLVFTEGVDDAPSECDLDDFNQWDLIISNNNSEESEEALNTVLDFLNKAI
ncbi:unnamed protein product [Psylliodes chrysocephalus]|uniref:Phosphomevalonate kinase n=1 Tax=Psylliodes chrysocephalus TaxID=3402493 RepID=A0A9P0D0X0_9CUCU|nr:unnamed protein product [Psylliodes chrysocephala]